jgi:2-polyprenyl-3-methyl-5-hydroxy-6-metoxy-1,4-benzoquinol methylase
VVGTAQKQKEYQLGMRNTINMLSSYLSIYRHSPLSVKLHLIIRFLSCPFKRIEKYIPKKGVILDVGCGHGGFTHYLSLTSDERFIIGSDVAKDKIKHAISTITDKSNIKFQHIDFNDMELTDLDCISIIDVLYLIPFEDWQRLFEKCWKTLKTGGALILKDMDKKPAWKYYWCIIQETLSVKVFNITFGNNFFFRNADEVVSILKSAGFEVEPVRIDKHYPHSHIIYVCKKI